VQVFSDNNVRTAKAEAASKQRVISARFPQYQTYVRYTSPYWRLKVGDFRTQQEANAAAEELRKAADDLDVINRGNRQAYLQKAGDRLSEEALIAMLDAETWLTAEDCIRLGLADEYAEKDADMADASAILQHAKLNLEQRIHLQKALAAQLREVVHQPAQLEQREPEAPPPEPQKDPEPNSQTAGIMGMLGGMFTIRK